jgi:hypothetical protein
MESIAIKNLKFFVLRGTLSDLSLFDFSMFNAKILEISDPAFKKILDQYPSSINSDANWKFFQGINDELKGTEKLYVLFPLNLSEQFSKNELVTCYYILLLLFPSDLTINYIIHFQLLDNKNLNYTADSDYGFYSTGENNYFDNYAYIYDKFLPDINEFIKLFKERYKRIKYLKNSLESYVGSYRDQSLHQAYLDLCISLESIIEGSNEVLFRIKHHISKLCADNEYHAKIIFTNLNKIYSLRSKIIHGESYDYSIFSEYLPYLRSIVSRMIIELVLLNIPDRKKLDIVLTFAGFNKQPNLTTDYIEMTLNISSFVDTFTKRLK